MTKVRRVLSILLFLLGGFCVGMQVMVAFIAGGGTADYAGRTAYFLAIAVAVLAVATLASPGRRWRELGLTILIGAAVCVGSFSTAIFLPDERGVVMGGEQLRPYLALGPGFANLALLMGTGLLLYVRGGDGTPGWLGNLARNGMFKLGVTMRASLQAIRRK